MNDSAKVSQAFRAAFPVTVPILAGFAFLGIAYGVFMNVSGFGVGYTFLMSLLIFAGSMEFVAVGLLLGPFNPLGALLLTLMVNARHLFYGLSMLEKYKGTGWKKPYLIFGMCDESFSINYSANIPQNIDRGWYLFFVTLLNHLYWVAGATVGGLLGSFVRFDLAGLEFVMTALFVVIFVEQWMKQKVHHSAIIGIGVSAASLILFGGERFIVPAMIAILAVLTLTRKASERKAAEAEEGGRA
ncbi:MULTISPECIES: azaleucine resistance protein AzlC [Saccharibacillus]|uniref:Azaleucine resistance protein AzlC n=1 Tax=Saccharibacillus brassicae TaxID=2583377 RepID=A0A4Y6V024_SACBS|nr:MULTISPECIES: azaleucine resistance protein AzlC [Saccharibacillus]MWJ29577.1 azaleucine resistance protein AzlC [Saccharibacillus sp. WB 17]QDH21837.1 azaleucine resistance protein AzlC [Saccharibacillus brassicae]